MEAISRLYENTPYKAFEDCWIENQAREYTSEYSRVLLEGTDFDLVYFPLKHLGYKAVISVTGEHYARMSHPRTLSVTLGVSSKLDYPQISELWSGMVAAAKEHGYRKVFLDLIPSRNGLVIALSSMGEISLLSEKRRTEPKSKDLICVSGRLGAAYLGQCLLENERRKFDASESADRDKVLEKYRLFVGAYLKPELSPNVPRLLEDEEIYPSAGCFVANGLSDAIKRLSRDTGLGAKVYADRIPFEGNSFELGKSLDVDPISAAMNGGDDYCLLFTIPILKLDKFRHDFQSFGIIGHLAQKEVGTVLVAPDGAELPLKAQGWREEESPFTE